MQALIEKLNLLIGEMHQPQEPAGISVLKHSILWFQSRQIGLTEILQHDMNGSKQIQFIKALQYGNSIRFVQDQIQFMANALRREVVNKGAPFRDQSQCIVRKLEPITFLISDSAIQPRGVVNERMLMQNADQPLL